MQPNRLDAPRTTTSRRSSLIVLAALVFAVAALLSSCKPEDGNKNGDTSPTPTPTPGGIEPVASSIDDRPIIITGGSLDLFFNHDDYVLSTTSPTPSPTGTASPATSPTTSPTTSPATSTSTSVPPTPAPSPSPQTFRSDKTRITALQVYDDDKADTATPICGGEHTFAAGTNVTVTVYYRVGGGGARLPLTIASSSSTTAGNHVDVTFDTSKLPRRSLKSNKNYNKSAKIDGVSYNDGTEHLCPDLPTNGKLTVEITAQHQP